MHWMKLREVMTGDFVLVNGHQIGRVGSRKNETGSPVAAARVLVIWTPGSDRPGLYVPIDSQGEFTPDESDHETVLRNFREYAANLSRRTS